MSFFWLTSGLPAFTFCFIYNTSEQVYGTSKLWNKAILPLCITWMLHRGQYGVEHWKQLLNFTLNCFFLFFFVFFLFIFFLQLVESVINESSISYCLLSMCPTYRTLGRPFYMTDPFQIIHALVIFFNNLPSFTSISSLISLVSMLFNKWRYFSRWNQ